MIKTIIFDNNGVLVTSNEETGFPALEKYLGKEKMKEFIPIYKNLAEKLDEGKITTNNFFRIVVKKTKINLTPEKLKAIQYGSFRVKKEVLKIAKSLSPKYELAVLSNFGDGYWELNKKWRIDNIVPRRNIFVSYELKTRKPKLKIYRLVLKKLGRKSSEVIFIDDDPIFVRAARSVGINAILFTTPHELKKKLKYILEQDGAQ